MAHAQSEPQGCFALVTRFVRWLFGARPLPYRQRDDFLSPAEAAFFRVLHAAVGNRWLVCPKVRLGDLFYVSHPEKNPGARARIAQKHVDFVLVDPATLRPVAGVELDDSSHQRPDRIERDRFVNEVFTVARLPLVHVPVRRTYDARVLETLLLDAVAGKPTRVAPVASDHFGVPLCPNCRVPMVLRTAMHGPNAGDQFYGCANYPRCRETARAE